MKSVVTGGPGNGPGALQEDPEKERKMEKRKEENEYTAKAVWDSDTLALLRSTVNLQSKGFQRTISIFPLD